LLKDEGVSVVIETASLEDEKFGWILESEAKKYNSGNRYMPSLVKCIRRITPIHIPDKRENKLIK
jgi:hypothetical protein